jgi:GAF domain-containing protein
MPAEMTLVRTLVELADTLVDDFDVVELLATVVERCVGVLGVSAAGIMLAAADSDLRVIASSSEAMRVLELFELQTSEGPCLDSFTTGEPVVNRVLADASESWPNFAAEAIAAGFYSVQALPLRLRGTVIGALNLFHTSTDPMSTDDIGAAQALADIATIAILQRRATSETRLINEQLTIALTSRISIEQAKGAVAERLGLQMDVAFNVLRRHARSHNRRLSDVAYDVVNGVIPVGSLDQLIS